MYKTSQVSISPRPETTRIQTVLYAGSPPDFHPAKETAVTADYLFSLDNGNLLLSPGMPHHLHASFTIQGLG
jgi:hypothetical protein